LPWLYWVGYTLFIGLVIMNIVVAVILEGYDESKASDEGAIIDGCKNLWGRKYDPDHKMALSGGDGVRFIVEAIMELQADGLVGGDPISVPVLRTTGFGAQLSMIPMKYAKGFDISFDSETGNISFFVAIRQVFRLIVIVENREGSDSIVSSLAECDERVHKSVNALKLLERKTMGNLRQGNSLTIEIAAAKLQNRFRRRQAEKAAQRQKESNTPEIQCVSLCDESVQAQQEPGDVKPSVAVG